MNDFLAHAKKLITLLSGHPWGSPACYVTLAVSAIVLFFGAGTIARVIFGKDTGLFRTACAALLVLLAAIAAHSGAGVFGAAPALAHTAAAVAALAAIWPAGRLIGTPYGQSFGIMLFALATTLGAAYGTGYVCGVLADGAQKLDGKTPLNLAK